MSDEQAATCALCGEPMPEGEEMFKYHGYSGPCPTPFEPKHPMSNLPDFHPARVAFDRVNEVRSMGPNIRPPLDAEAFIQGWNEGQRCANSLPETPQHEANK